MEGKGRTAVRVEDETLIVQAVAMVRHVGPIGSRPVVVDYAPVGQLRVCPDVSREAWPPEIWQEFGPPPERIPELDFDAERAPKKPLWRSPWTGTP